MFFDSVNYLGEILQNERLKVVFRRFLYHITYDGSILNMVLGRMFCNTVYRQESFITAYRLGVCDPLFKMIQIFINTNISCTTCERTILLFDRFIIFHSHWAAAYLNTLTHLFKLKIRTASHVVRNIYIII